jgi:hypothetical protein
MASKQGSAFITTSKGFCYLTVKCVGRNFHVMRIRNYTIDANDKRDMRRRYPEVAFDWKKITRQLAEKRELCRQYRSRRRSPDAARPARAQPLHGIYDPITRTVYVDGVPSSAGGAGALLDAILHMDRASKDDPSPLPSPSSRKRRF